MDFILHYCFCSKVLDNVFQVLLAMEDYAKAYKLNPKLTIAVFSRAQYYFDQNNWQAAINDFSEFLRKCPFDPNARLLRGQAYAKLGSHQVAIQMFPIDIEYLPQFINLQLL